MPNITNGFSMFEPDVMDSKSNLFPIWALTTFVSFLLLAYSLIRFAERTNRIEYEDRLTCIIAGFIKLVIRVFHANDDPLPIPAEGPTLIAVGPHRTGLDPIALSSNLEGNPPRFLATDSFNKIPGIASFLHRFKAIIVSKNSNSIEQAVEALEENGCVALFPQGNFALIGKEPPIIYSGTAKIAILTQTPIHVVRLDGFWSLKNHVPLFVRNNRAYRAFISGFHWNNVKSTPCGIIDFHLDPDNAHLPEDEIINEINAQLYAYFYRTEELSPEKIEIINQQITEGKHIGIWQNRQNQYQLEKELKTLKAEYKQLDGENATEKKHIGIWQKRQNQIEKELKILKEEYKQLDNENALVDAENALEFQLQG